MPPIDEQILDCVLYMYSSVESAQAGISVGGTGFLVGLESELAKGIWYLYAVTNEHVISNGFPVIRLNTQAGDTDTVPLTADNWVPHKDGDDISAAHLGWIDRSKFKYSFLPERGFLSQATITKYKIRPGDDCFMVGRFIMHEGKQRNLPSVRFGNISMMPIEPVRHFDGKDHLIFLVETRSLSGYSGSPVFVYFDAAWARVRGQVTVGATPGPWLLGVDAGTMPFDEPVYVIDDQGEIVRDEDTKEPVKSHLIAQSNSGQMGVVPAWKLRELLYYEDFVMARKESDKLISGQQTKKVLRPDVRTKQSNEAVKPFTKSSFEDALRQASRKVPESELQDSDKSE